MGGRVLHGLLFAGDFNGGMGHWGWRLGGWARLPFRRGGPGCSVGGPGTSALRVLCACAAIWCSWACSVVVGGLFGSGGRIFAVAFSFWGWDLALGFNYICHLLIS